ncbi:DMT family transporter [Rhodoferax saidenbachensis]|uniref:Drug/metabolite transporter (DMT)-like permease n=1 Tax=Rhodoferax saidenbachensis TaxID=1484693 RepID=A0ABU1ZT49_9BURK|nr:DMT family transporter [Rhodoferax saidenbachensis]MDR7308568.1 drug/metabolite transporter (DMT)-like permease [Rhodoferax saidenbachensis]
MNSLKKGLSLGVLGVTIFALTLPMTRLAVGTPDAPLMSGMFIAFGRAVVAGVLSGLLLWWGKAPLPPRDTWGPLVLVALGVVFGFPLFTSIAMRHVEAVHASVMVGVLPLATAVVGAFLNRQRPSTAFWVCALAGTALVVAFAILRSGHNDLSLQMADVLLLLAMACAAVGYGHGGRLSQRMRAEYVICWALVIALPINLPLAVWQFPEHNLPASAWAAFAYVSVFSMWLGFFAWYKGLALGGTVRVSQVQLLQPFLGMLFAVPILGERLDAVTVGFGVAVIATVFIGRRMPVQTVVKGAPA